MKLYQNVYLGVRYKHWSFSETITYIMKGVARELGICPSFFANLCAKRGVSSFLKRWLYKNGAVSYFNFKGCKLPDISNSPEKLNTLRGVFEDVFLFPCFFNDNYDKSTVVFMDSIMSEGPYGYTDGSFDVTVKKGDIVIDAGAWMGDFSAYAVSRGATSYAFEPVNETYQLLCETKMLNNVNGGGDSPCPKRIGR